MKDLITVIMFIVAYVCGTLALINIIFRKRSADFIVAGYFIIATIVFLSLGFIFMTDQTGWSILIGFVLLSFVFIIRRRPREMR